MKIFENKKEKTEIRKIEYSLFNADPKFSNPKFKFRIPKFQNQNSKFPNPK